MNQVTEYLKTSLLGKSCYGAFKLSMALQFAKLLIQTSSPLRFASRRRTALLQKRKNAFVGSSFAAGEINRARERAERRLDELDEMGRARKREKV
jgi:hypothetical protein